MHCVDLGEGFPKSIYYLLAKFGFDTAENEPCKVCPLSAYRSLRFTTIHTGSHGSEQDAKPAVVRGRRTKKVVNFDVPVASARKLVRAKSAGLPTAKSSGLAEPLLDPADKLKVLWPLISNARTGEKAKEISKSVFPFSRTF